MADEEPLYVGVFDPVDLRKDLLNSSKVIITSLRKYEQFISARDEKAKCLAALSMVFREINVLNKRLMHLMPKTKIKPGMIKRPELEEQIRPRVVKHVGRRAPAEPAAMVIKEKTRLAELEDELVGIEEKLGKIE